MKIVEFATYRVRIQLRKPIRHASHARTETESILVCCELEDGTIGWGEGLPREYVTGETIDDAWSLLKEVDFAREFGGTFSGLDDVVSRLRGFKLAAANRDGRGCFGNSVRCAIELSVLDAACRVEGIPLSAVTARLPETAAIRKQSPRVQYSAPFTAMSPAKQIRRALLLRLAGFQQVKVKTGVEGIDDVALLGRLRRWLGTRFDIRLDANEAWSCANLPRRLEPLLPFQISCVEQPVPHEEVDGLAALRGQVGVPFMLDESLCSRVDAERAIEKGTCDFFNIRLSKCGGFLPSLELAALAQSAGLGYQLGCQVGETGILSAAGRHFATSVANIRYLEGSYDRFLVKERLTREDLTFGWGGRAPAIREPGLGVIVEESAIKRVTLQEQRYVVS